MPPKVNKVEADLKKLTKLDGNNICANCPEKMPGYAEMTHCIFIWLQIQEYSLFIILFLMHFLSFHSTKCAGVHREYQYKVKGISMSSFTDEDVQQLSRVGNEAHNAVYMARFTPREFQIPNGSDIVKLKEFIRMKYVDRRWYGDPTAIENNSRAFSSNFQPYAAAIDLAKYPIAPPKHPVEKVASRSSASLALPSQNAYQDPFSGLVYGQTTATPTYFDPFKSDPVPSAADSAFNPFGSNVAQPNSSQSSSNGSFDPFGDASAKAAGAFQAFNNGNYNNSNAGFNAFTSPHPNPSANPFNVVPTRQSYPVQHIGSSPFELFGSNVEHPTISQLSNNGLFNPFGDTSTKATGAFSAFDDLLEAETAANLTISGGLGEPSVLSRGLPAMDETITALKKILNSERERRKALESEVRPNVFALAISINMALASLNLCNIILLILCCWSIFSWKCSRTRTASCCRPCRLCQSNCLTCRT